jgi:hypothetical protein
MRHNTSVLNHQKMPGTARLLRGEHTRTQFLVAHHAFDMQVQELLGTSLTPPARTWHICEENDRRFGCNLNRRVPGTGPFAQGPFSRSGQCQRTFEARTRPPSRPLAATAYKDTLDR